MKKQLLFMLSCLVFISGIAQSFKLKSHQGISDAFNVAGANQKIKFTPTAAKTIFGLDASSQLVLIKTQPDKLGFVHYHFYQSYKNFPIDKTMFVVHTKNGLLQSTSGTIVIDFGGRPDNNTSISADRAISIAIANVAAREYAWQNTGMEQRIKTQTNNPKASYYPTATLVFYNPQSSLKSRELRLCYKVDVYAFKPLSRADYFIDAQTGKILGKKDRIYQSDAEGTANTAYSGIQIIHSDKTGPDVYRLRDYTKGNGVITLHGEANKFGDDYKSSSDNWNLKGDNQAAIDAHYGVSETYKFYMNKFGRNSYDDYGTALYSYVNDPSFLDNAFWDGTAMYFNKRADGKPGGVTGIDVTGHELTHGVTQETCGLNYLYESGAINESLSDIMGKSVQFTAKPTDVDWKISNDMNWVIRDMSNPNAQGQPDTYKGSYWYDGAGDNGGVHLNSGVGNFMFYLLTEGGAGTNDRGNAYKVAGIGLEKADQIIYRTQTVYLTENAQYTDWRDAAIIAAKDLYGEDSREVTSVKNAFYAVGIGTDSSACGSPTGLAATGVARTTATISWTPLASNVGFNLQYKLLTSNTWRTVSNISGTSYEISRLIPGVTYEFRVQTICSGGGKSFSETGNFTTLSAGRQYCESYGFITAYEYIDRVGFNNKGYTSGDNDGYANLISTGVVLRAGVTDSVVLTPGFRGSPYVEYWKVYVDYNDDGDFDEAEEFVGAGVSDGPGNEVKLAVRVPWDAANGLTRARIQMSYFEDELEGPCSVFTYGETEDYSVFIRGATPSAETLKPAATALIVSPNPVKGTAATVSLDLAKPGNVHITITDLSGSILIKQTIANANAGKSTVPLNGLEGLRDGAFMIVAEQNGVIIARTQFIVAK